jgi:hypothetical protein
MLRAPLPRAVGGVTLRPRLDARGGREGTMHDHTDQKGTHRRLQQRGLMAGAAALVGAGLTKVLGAARAEAGHTGAADNVFHLEGTNNQGDSGETSTGIASTTAWPPFQLATRRWVTFGDLSRYIG